MCGVIVVDVDSFRSTSHGRDAIFIIIALVIVITLRFSINCSTIICSPIVLFAFMREGCSETYGRGSIFHHISFWSTIFQSFVFRSINQKTQKYFIFRLVPSISIRSHLCKWPWRDWQPLYRVGCKCLIVYVGTSIGDLHVSPTGLILSGKLIHEHLWGRRTGPLSVRQGAEIARRADRGEAHEQFTQLRSSPER